VSGPIRNDCFGGLVTEESWADASGRNMVLAYRIRDWGHQWPGGTFTKNLPEHHNLKEFDAAQVIWRFFLLHSYRAAPAATNCPLRSSMRLRFFPRLACLDSG